jgi:hypothetical protein
MNSNSTLPERTLQESLLQLVPVVTDLLKRITHVDPVVTASGEGGTLITAALTFPDHIGEGSLVAELFRYRDALRLDIRIDHNRYFALADGAPTERRCFLNDYVASHTMAPGEQELPTEFVRNVVAGVSAARDAVHRHNKRCQAPWNEVRVAAATPEPIA